MKFSLTLWRKLVLLHLTMVVAGVMAFGYIAHEIVSGTIQTQHTDFLAIRQKDAKIRANETAEMLNRGVASTLDELRRAVVSAVDAADHARVMSQADDSRVRESTGRRMAATMTALRLDIFTALDRAGRVVVRGSDPRVHGDLTYAQAGKDGDQPTVDMLTLVKRACAGQTTAAIEALPEAMLATERYTRANWTPPVPKRDRPRGFTSGTLADFAEIALLSEQLPMIEPHTQYEKRGMAMVVVAPVRDSSGAVLGAIAAGRILNRTPGVLSRHLGVRGDIGALYLGKCRIAVAADAAGVAKPVGDVLDESVAQALLAGGITPAVVEALASIGDLGAYRVLLDSQKRAIGAVCARTPTSQFVVEIEGERVSERLAQANSQRIILLTATIAAMLALAIIIVYAERLSKPLRELVRLSRSIASGNLNVRAPEKGGDEVSMLARSMNQMATELEKSYGELEDKVIERTRSLQMSEARYRDLIESAPDMIHILDDEGRILSVNAREVKVLGYARNALGQMHLRDIVAPRCWDATEQAVRGAFLSLAPQRYETVLVTRDGEEIVAEVTTMTRRENGRSIQTNIIRDVTEQRRLQHQLIESERLSAVGELVSGVAHEIRNPLNTLGITVRNLKDDIARDEPREEVRKEYDESLDILVSELDRLDRLTDDFMKVVRIPDVVSDECDLGALIADLLGVVSAEAKELGVEILSQLPDPLDTVRADTELLRQAFLNLLLNGMQAVERGGRVEVRIAQDPEQTVVSFADNGCGIPPDDRDQVFDIFFTTKAGGAGIGLSLVHRIARGHGGSVTFDTQVGKGSTFHFALPANSPRAEAGRADEPREPA